MDTLGCAIGGAAEPEVQALAAALMNGADGALRLPGIGQGLSQEAFTVVFAAASCWHEACEGLAAAHGRPGLHAIPAVLGTALAGQHPMRDLLDAVIAGYEVGGRLGIAYRIKPGMHVDGTWGSFAAGAAASRLAGLTVGQTLAALNGLACHLPFSLYRPIAQGSTARNAYVGHGAWLGRLATAAAQAGMGGPPGTIPEAYRLAIGRELPALTPAPGTWLIQDGYLKAYPAVKHVHYGAEAAVRWHAEPGASPAAISRVVLTIYEEATAYCGNRAPATAIQAQFSLSYGLAWALLHGSLTPQAYATNSLSDPEVQRIEALVQVVARPDASRSCTLDVTSGSATRTIRVDTVDGDPAQPMGEAEVAAKFRAYAGPVIGARAERLIEQVLHGGLDQAISLD